MSAVSHVSACQVAAESFTIRGWQRRGMVMQIRQERQLNPVADEVLALTAVVRPILLGVLFALKGDVVRQAGGRANITLALLARLYRAGDVACTRFG